MRASNPSQRLRQPEPPGSKPSYRFGGTLPAALEPLRARRQWLTWTYIWNAKRGKWDKPPRSAHTGEPASINDAADLGTFEEAAATAARLGMAGVGFLLMPDDGITGIDLDRCIEESGCLTDLAAEIIGFGETYAEVSPSGKGLRLFASGKVAKVLKNDPLGIEVYPARRYLTITGSRYEGAPNEIRSAPRSLACLTDAVEAAKPAKPEHTKRWREGSNNNGSNNNGSNNNGPTAAQVALALGAQKTGANSWMARCPLHDDGTASLSISAGENGKLLAHCHAGCDQKALYKALCERASPSGGYSNGKFDNENTRARRIVKVYDYTDEAGELLLQSVRFEPKDFRQRRPDGRGEFIWNVKGVRVVPYRLPEVVEAIANGTLIFVCEGEKDCNALARLGIIATTNAGGAGKWRAEHAACLNDADVIIVPDNDDPGRDHADGVATSLSGIAARARILTLPGLPDKGDISDWLAAGGTVERLWALVGQAPEWQAPAARDDTGRPAGPLRRERAEVDVDFYRNADGVIVKTEGNIRLALAKAGITLAFNAFALQRTVEGLPGYGPDLTDAAIDAMWVQFERVYRVRFGHEHFRTVVRVEAQANSYHPVREYFDSLTWDGKPRLDKWLATYAGAEDTELNTQFGRLTLIAAVRRIRRPGTKFDAMLVLEGPEGRNKSTLFEVLASKDWFSDDAPLAADAREAIESLRGKLIIEAAELAAMKSVASVEKLKAFLSRTHDRASMKYERETTEAPRQGIFVGTTNSAEYLQSKTGNRRFWPVKVGEIDLVALRRVRDQLWAEAAHYEATGASIMLPREFWAVAAVEQEKRREADEWEGVVAEWLSKQSKAFFTAADVAREALHVQLRDLDGASQRRVTQAMRMAGWSKDKGIGKTVRGVPHWGRVKTPEKGDG